MKIKKTLLFLAVLCVFTTLSCTSIAFNSSVKKYYEAGDYIEALTSLIPLLKQDPHFDEGMELLPVVYQEALQQNGEIIAVLKKSGTPYDWDKVVYQYSFIHDINKDITKLPKLVHSQTKEEVTVDLRYFHTELGEAKTQAAEAHYQAGLALKNQGGSIETYQAAIKEFNKAVYHIANYKDIPRQIKETKTFIAELYYQAGITLKEDVATRQALLKAIDRFKAALSYIPSYKDTVQQIEDTKKLIAETYYQAGLALKQTGSSRQDYKQAIIEFETALSYAEKYKDIQTQIQETEALLMNRVIIIATRNSYIYDYYVNTETIIQNKILSEILNDRRTQKYTTILSRDQLNRALKEQELSVSDLADESTAVEIGAILGANLILAISIDSVIYTDPQITSSMNEVTKEFKTEIEVDVNATAESNTKTDTDETKSDFDTKYSLDSDFESSFGSVSKPKPEKQTKTIIETETASAIIFHYKKKATAAVTCSYKIIDVSTLEIKKAATFTQKAISEVEWATFSGDERAIPDDYKTLLLSAERDTEPPKNLIIQAADMIAHILPKPIIEYLE